MSGSRATKNKALKCVPKTVEHKAGDRWITMSNALTRAGHGLTLAEKRLIMISVSKLDSYKPIKFSDAPTTKITANEYAEVFEVDIDTAYKQLKSGAKNLYNRSISFYEPAFNRKGKPISPTVVNMHWVGRIQYHKDEGYVELFWWHQVVPHLFNIRKQFTSYQLKQASALRCSYSWKLLELLMRFKSTGVAKYTIEDFCESMNATEKQRANFAAIRRKMIEPAIKELTIKDDWVIEWKPIKAGRKVKELQFVFGKNPQPSLFQI